MGIAPIGMLAHLYEVFSYKERMKTKLTFRLAMLLGLLFFMGHNYAADVKEKRQELQKEKQNVAIKQKELDREIDKESHSRSSLDTQQDQQRVWRASKILGSYVKNLRGNTLGDIKELVVDPDRGRIVYAVLSVGGFLGIKDKLFAVPWTALKLSRDKEYYTLDIDKEKLKGAPGFDQKAWPDMADEHWRADVYKYYNQKPEWQQERGSVGTDKSASQVIDDTVITAKVKAALLVEPEVKSTALSVETDKGSVTLKGTVANAFQVKRAIETARHVEGVKSVKSEVTLKAVK